MPNPIIMGDLNCYFHKDRTAVHKCEQCGKYICLECQHDSSDYNYGSSSTTKTKICPYCYADKLENNTSGLVAVLGCLGFIVFVLIGCAIFGTFESSSSFPSPYQSDPEPFLPGYAIVLIVVAFLIISGIIIYIMLKKDNEPNEAADKIRAKAKKAIEDSKITVAAEEKHTPLYCRFCGAPIEAYEKVCSYCGMNWIWKKEE